MNKDLRKRLEEAARKFKGTYLENLNIVRELKGKEPLSADDELIDLCLDVAELAYKEGAEWMFKEYGGETVLKEMRQTILGQVANWLYKWNQKNAEKFENQERLSLTEGTVPVYTLMSDINKLWEGEKYENSDDN